MYLAGASWKADGTRLTSRLSINKFIVKLSLTWEVDGRQTKANRHHENRTRRIHVSRKGREGGVQDVYYVFVAPGCLIFAEGRVYFQCRSAVMSLDTFADEDLDVWSRDWINSPLRTLGELERRAFWFYMKCVRLYTGRSLTKPKDVLAAFQGIPWLLEQHLNAPLLNGLPTSHFDLALLWTPLQRLERRKQKGHGRDCPVSGGNASQGSCQCAPRDDYEGIEFPSWSWCGWQGGKTEYEPDMIGGCLQDVQQWLRCHTWIQWHVRDHRGRLRPLWDVSSMREDPSKGPRWRGYSGLRTRKHHLSGRRRPAEPQHMKRPPGLPDDYGSSHTLHSRDKEWDVTSPLEPEDQVRSDNTSYTYGCYGSPGAEGGANKKPDGVDARIDPESGDLAEPGVSNEGQAQIPETYGRDRRRESILPGAFASILPDHPFAVIQGRSPLRDMELPKALPSSSSSLGKLHLVSGSVPVRLNKEN
ncbi:hypothetical protein F4780DRAFT_753673 [Xylariomycetidae sp. FL0641]|nr:hypothetical protein F4780DRAFT_753673 [Xylariomycetidae sp. FL0641]